MGKLEKEVKILNVNKKELEMILSKINARKIEESLQQIYVYDLPSIYARFYDCLLQLKQINKTYQFEICRNKLQGILTEIDNLTTKEEQRSIEQKFSTKSLVDLLSRTNNEDLLSRFSDKSLVESVKKYGINPNKWVRVRQTNGKTTITIKHILNPDMQTNNNGDMQKVLKTEMEVPSIEEANSILEQLGFSFRNYQEKNRATYDVDGVEVDIDSWPLIPTYVEIENDSTELIQSTIKKLGLQEHEIVSCNTADIYNKYGIDLYQFRELKFPQRENEGRGGIEMNQKNNSSLKLIEPTEEYKEQIMNYRKTFLEKGENLSGCALLENCKSFDEWIDFENRLSKEYGEGYVPSTVYLAVRIKDNKLVGIIDFRHYLSDFLLNYGGNIGYSILPEERRKGYAKEMLHLMLKICKEKGVEKVLITCDKNNIASAKTIMSNDGILENEISDNNIISKSGTLQRYWISLKE